MAACPGQKSRKRVERYTVACVQQRLRLPLTTDELRESLRRFMRAAENKRARLLVFPELAGMMIVPPLLVDFRSSLLKRADVGRRRSATLWQKMTGAISGSAAGILKANYQTGLAGLLDVSSGDLWESYSELFSGLAKEFGVTIVAPSMYLPDPFDGVIRNLAAVFGPDGALLGTQAKVMLTKEDEFYCRPGTTWDVIHTEVGALGLILGGDVLYPEVGRLLAFHGAEALICMGAAGDQATYNKLRAGSAGAHAGQPDLRRLRIPRRPQLLLTGAGRGLSGQVGDLRTAGADAALQRRPGGDGQLRQRRRADGRVGLRCAQGTVGKERNVRA